MKLVNDYALKIIADGLDITNLKSVEDLGEYYFEDKIEEIIEPKNMLKEFFSDYYLKVCHAVNAETIDTNEKQLFVDWFNMAGKTKFFDVYDNLAENKVHLGELAKVLLYYDFFMEDSLENGEYEQLLDWLYQIPTNIYSKLNAMGYLHQEIEDFILDYGTLEKTMIDISVDFESACSNAGFFVDVNRRTKNVGNKRSIVPSYTIGRGGTDKATTKQKQEHTLQRH